LASSYFELRASAAAMGSRGECQPAQASLDIGRRRLEQSRVTLS